MSGFFENLTQRLFGKGSKAKQSIARRHPTAVEGSGSSSAGQEAVGDPATSRGPYFIQVGFDFGTAFSKCVCRDINLDKAWIHMPPGSMNTEMPFLLHNAIAYKDGHFQYSGDGGGAYKSGGLNHVKIALQKIGRGELDDMVLAPFSEALPERMKGDLPEFVECCAVYLLAGAFSNVRADIAKRFPGSIAGDYVAINMAVPVADADFPKVNEIFERVLRRAWVISDDLAGHSLVPLASLQSTIRSNDQESMAEQTREACFIYPEVSANVQGFVRSPNSRPGLYIFSDTGAGTVDQSVFLFVRRDGQDRLTYLHADVFPLGSSHIEQIAADQDGDPSWSNLERLRLLKESGQDDTLLCEARRSIYTKLLTGTRKTIAFSKEKLINPNQINQIRVIFGGGGHCETPYRSGVINIFDDVIFRLEEIENRRRKREHFDLGMPNPRDLSLNQTQDRWMNRLTVAYGLSFEKGQLATFRLPRSVGVPAPEQIWRPRTSLQTAISKDEV